VKASIQAVHDAGIHTIMVTGDHPGTARTVGQAVGLFSDDGEMDRETAVVRGSDLKPPDELSAAERERILGARIFARVTPEQKLNLIDLHQSENAIVAMTGDGVNDAPALQKADIGVAMGQRGTDVAKEAADVVLQDDSFGSIAVAVEYGRVIFANIRKFTNYLISGNIGEIVAVAIAALANLPLPLLPLQILYLNVLNDVFPSLALGMSGDLPGVMEEPPRDPDEPIMTRAHWTASASYGVIIGLVVLAALLIALNVFGMDQTRAVTISFLTVAFSRLWHVFNMRNQKGGFIDNEVTRNPFVWGALVLCVILLLLAVYWTPFANLLKLANPGLNGWLLIGGMSLIPLVIGQILKALKVGEM
jgi:Ca2+-transporting ATPase